MMMEDTVQYLVRSAWRKRGGERKWGKEAEKLEIEAEDRIQDPEKCQKIPSKSLNSTLQLFFHENFITQ